MLWFNKNRSCIEIFIAHPAKAPVTRLIKTEVVLKSNSVKKEFVVLVFNKNRSCIEMGLLPRL